MQRWQRLRTATDGALLAQAAMGCHREVEVCLDESTEAAALGYGLMCGSISRVCVSGSASTARIKPLWKLRSLGLDGAACEGISDATEHASTLECLEVCGSRLGVRELGAFGLLSRLESLTLDNTEMGGEGAVALSKALPCLTQLKRLSLSWNGIGAVGAVALSGALPSLAQLQWFDLSWNSIGGEGAAALSGALPSLTQLQTLT